MQITELCELEFNATYGSTISQDGRFIVFCKAQELEVVELESSNGLVQYLLNDEAIHTYYPFKVAFFEDYVVLVNIRQVADHEQYLRLLKFYFRSGLSQKLNLPQPQIDWDTMPRERVCYYPKLPADVCGHFNTDFLYFEDSQLDEIFETHKIVVEVIGIGASDFQIIDVNNIQRLLLPFNMKIPSPFIMPYIFEWTEMSKCRIRKYNNGKCSKSHLWILNKYAFICTITDSIFFMNQIFDNQALLTSKRKILRKFRYLKATELNSHYIIIKQYGQGTIRIDMRTALAFWISDQEDTILRGKYIFTARKSTNPQTPTQSELRVNRIL